MASISEVHHVAITVSDLEKSLAFYQNVLGFRKTLDIPLGGPNMEKMLRLRPGMTGLGVQCYGELASLEIPQYGDVRVILFEDPDGIMIELMQLPAVEKVREHRKATA